ncbi:MAG TPA: cupredoxin domain-containing protein [Candidatus Acidoferrum sp.]|nr:cupredoxin domain-containing protein [Candidatus Acidoferrum sp.]
MKLSAIVFAVVLCVGVALPVLAGEITLTVVNIETPQGVKIWEPASLVAKKGDTVALKLINRHADEHGYEIAAFNVKEVVDGNKTKDVSFKADKSGIFPIKCHLHPAHVVGQLLVID